MKFLQIACQAELKDMAKNGFQKCFDDLYKPCYTTAFGDGPRNFEPWSSDLHDTRAGTPSPNCHTTPTGGRVSSR
ncbi:hypothetical protein TNCV_633651 [Trichonephila clavipes]|nr:hypothetical protein TNCV_633651 [Trichonephila clavipes]